MEDSGQGQGLKHPPSPPTAPLTHSHTQAHSPHPAPAPAPTPHAQHHTHTHASRRPFTRTQPADAPTGRPPRPPPPHARDPRIALASPQVARAQHTHTPQPLCTRPFGQRAAPPPHPSLSRPTLRQPATSLDPHPTRPLPSAHARCAQAPNRMSPPPPTPPQHTHSPPSLGPSWAPPCRPPALSVHEGPPPHAPPRTHSVRARLTRVSRPRLTLACSLALPARSPLSHTQPLPLPPPPPIPSARLPHAACLSDPHPPSFLTV